MISGYFASMSRQQSELITQCSVKQRTYLANSGLCFNWYRQSSYLSKWTKLTILQWKALLSSGYLRKTEKEMRGRLFTKHSKTNWAKSISLWIRQIIKVKVQPIIQVKATTKNNRTRNHGYITDWVRLLLGHPVYARKRRSAFFHKNIFFLICTFDDFHSINITKILKKYSVNVYKA